MNYCVVVKIARRKVSFCYQSEGSPYAPLEIKDSNEVPLYFYVNGNDFIFGNAARDRFFSNDPNAFGNYFEIIKDPSAHFTIYNNKKPCKQLFYFGVEQYLSHFINTVLYNSNSIESYRPNFPLRFLFETDIEDKEKSLIENIFAEAGYNNIERVDYNECLFEVLNAHGVINPNKSILLLNGIDNNLYLELYKNLSDKETATSKLEGHGADPRVKMLAEIILDYIALQNSYLSFEKEKEVAFLLPFCADLLKNILPIIKGNAELSDGKLYWFSVKERDLNDRLIYYSNDSLIYTAIDDLLKSATISVEKMTILLASDEINTSYFSEKLLKKYPNVTGLEALPNAETMKLLFSKIAQSGYLAKKKASTILEAPKVIAKPEIPSGKPSLPEFKKIEKPVANKPPILPPKKENLTNSNKPGLPEIPKTEIKKPVLPPPLPTKKNN